MVACSFPSPSFYPNSTILKTGRDSCGSLGGGELHLQTLLFPPETPSECNKVQGEGPGGSGHLWVCQNESLISVARLENLGLLKKSANYRQLLAEEKSGHCSFEGNSGNLGQQWKFRNVIHISYCLIINN